MPLTPQQQSVINALPVGQREAYQAAYESQNSPQAPGASASGPGVSSSSVTQNRQGSTSTTVDPMVTGGVVGYQTLPGQGTVNASGAGNAPGNPLTQTAYEGQQQTQLSSQLKLSEMQQAAKLQQDAEARRLGYLSTLTGQAPAPVTMGGVNANEQGARDAAFARAKEQAGNTALASLKALQGVMANTGRMGGSQEAAGEAAIIGGAGGDINDFTRDQLMLDLNRAADIADTQYQGGITQRGQNISMIPSLAGLISSSGSLY